MNLYDTIKVDDNIIYRPNFGTGTPLIGTVIAKGIHKGQPVVDLSNGSWAYAHQIDSIYEVAA